jgi:hypothetical protein
MKYFGLRLFRIMAGMVIIMLGGMAGNSGSMLGVIFSVVLFLGGFWLTFGEVSLHGDIERGRYYAERKRRNK